MIITSSDLELKGIEEVPFKRLFLNPTKNPEFSL